ncbi:hypothetical protein ASZ90_011291 [hydrocarbon metagenome]|uniref:Uncharacterized protein n=1 Tax=hydrocarbon metagenome TaxID=938273 RepID=A0A0W8FEG7_9ZZZZ
MPEEGGRDIRWLPGNRQCARQSSAGREYGCYPGTATQKGAE